MGMAMKVAVAAVALGVLASPSATTSVLGHAHDAITSIRSEVGAELSQVHNPSARPDATHRAARPGIGRNAGNASSYRFTVTDGAGRPGRWNPCQSVPVLVNMDNAPAHAMRDLRTALQRIDNLTGLRFKIDGTTSALPGDAWGTQQWGNTSGWAPVLVAFARPGVGNLTADASGMTTPAWVDNGSFEQYVSASVVFNSEQNDLYTPGFRSENPRGELFMHEFGHLAGLDHVDDRTQVMYGQTGFVHSFGAGDRAGLKKLGVGGCLNTPAPAWG